MRSSRPVASKWASTAGYSYLCVHDSSAQSGATYRAGHYAVVNLTASRALSPEWSVQLRWNNVADKNYELVQGFVPPPANPLASLRWTPRP